MESPYIAPLLEEVTKLPICAAEVGTAREEFERAGTMRPEAPSFGIRCNAFLNWFVLDRSLFNGQTPIACYLERKSNKLTPEQKTGYQELTENIHSVFQLIRNSSKEILLKDMVEGYKYKVLATDQTAFLDVNSVLQTRLINHRGIMYFSNYMIIHPAEVESLIKKRTQAQRRQSNSSTELMFNLMLCQSRWEQFEKIDPRGVYRLY